MQLFSLLALILFLFYSVQLHATEATELFKKVSKSIFVVVNKDSSGQVFAQGSGVLVGNNKVVTNCHVIKEAATIILLQKGRQVSARLKTMDIERDLCILVMSQAINSPPVVAIDSSQLEIGQKVYAVGAPFGLELTLSDGIVSGLRSATSGSIIQTTAAISPGSSGGGLFDENGKLVGITTYQYAKGQNLNFALPSEWVQQISVRDELEKDLRHRRQEYKKNIKSLDSVGQSGNSDERRIAISQEYLRTDPNYISALFNLGFALKRSDHSQAAIPVYSKLVELPANTVEDYFLIGIGALDLSILYESTGETNLARIAASKAATYIPEKTALAHYWSFLDSIEHYREAIATYKLATDLYPESPEAWAYLAGCYMNVKAPEKAIYAYKKATYLKPDYEWAWLGYVVTLRQTGNKVETEKVVNYLYENHRDILNNILKAFGKK